MCSPYGTFVHLSLTPPNKALCSHENMYINVCSSFICNNQKLETIFLEYPSTGKWSNKLVHLENRILDNTKEILVCETIWTTRKKWLQLQSSVCITISKEQNSESSVLRVGEEKSECRYKDLRELWVDRIVLSL